MMSLRNYLLCWLSLIMLVGGFALRAVGRPPDVPSLKVKSTSEFEVTGDGSNPAWEKADWTPLHKRSSEGHSYEARFKVLYSKKGIYFLMDGTDSKLTASFTQDFEDLWTEDVYEVFLWTDERYSIYFEYEISPLNYELPILVPNFEGEFLGWRPWHYDGERKIRKATAVRGGPKKSGAAIQGWSAEFFIPYEVLTPLQNVPPKPGTLWRANFYRVDHDGEERTSWMWSRVEGRFHEYEQFGTLEFEE